MTGIQSLLRCRDDLFYRNLGNDHLNLYLRKKSGIHNCTAIAFGRALLNAAAHHLRHGHAGYTKLIQCLLQFIKLRQTADNGNLVHAGIQRRNQCRLLHHLDGSVLLRLRGPGHILLTKICVVIDVHIHVGNIRNGKAGISACKAMLMDIKSVNFHLRGNTQTNRLVDDLEGNEHYHKNICIDGDNSKDLYAKLGNAAAVEKPLSDAVRTG